MEIFKSIIVADPNPGTGFPRTWGTSHSRTASNYRYSNDQVRDTHERILAYTLNREMRRDFLFDEASS